MPKYNSLIKFSKSTRYRQRKKATALFGILPSINNIETQSQESNILNESKSIPLNNISSAFSHEVNLDTWSLDNLCTDTTSPLDNTFNNNTVIFENISEDHESDSNNSSESSFLTNSTENLDLKLILALWAIKHSITHSALSDLLKSLKQFPEFSDMPIDSRTLLKTPTTICTKKIKDGIYHHIGLQNEIHELLENLQCPPPVLMLNVGIDGLPITNNPPSQIWPILGYFSNVPTENKNVFIIGMYHGKLKPLDCNEFMFDFVEELKTLIDSGFDFKTKKIKIVFQALICDAPAKSFVLNVKGHTGKVSCVRCHSEGIWDTSRVCFPNIDSTPRTHEEFIQYSDTNFHNGKTILTELVSFDLVKSIPFDYMHCVCIGVMKKLLLFWTGSPKHVQTLPSNLITLLDERFNKLAEFTPDEFQRKFQENSRRHPLRDASRWKASELRQCLLYLGCVVFRDILSDEAYNHFLELFVAIRILVKDNCSEEYNNYANQLLRHFVSSFKTIYGKIYMSHNIHALIHVAEDSKKFGSLDSFSAFPFENFMQPLKKKIKTGVKPLQQLALRYAEIRAYNHYTHENLSYINKNGPINIRNKLENRPMLQEACEPQFSGWRTRKFSIKLNKANNHVKMINGDIVKIENIATNKMNTSKIIVIGRRYEKVSEYFSSPCSSSLFEIYEASLLGCLKYWLLDDIQEKVICMPVNDSTSVIVPFIHS